VFAAVGKSTQALPEGQSLIEQSTPWKPGKQLHSCIDPLLHMPRPLHELGQELDLTAKITRRAKASISLIYFIQVVD
jgi:hypothetical protein